MFYFLFAVFDVATFGGVVWIVNDCNKLPEKHMKLYIYKV